MPDRKTTSAIILKIEKTQELIKSLEEYYEYLEDLLKKEPSARNHARNVKNYLKVLKSRYLDNFKKVMKRLYDIQRKREKIAEREAEKRRKIIKKAAEEERKIKKGLVKIKKI